MHFSFQGLCMFRETVPQPTDIINSVALVRERNIPTERSPPVGEVSDARNIPNAVSLAPPEDEQEMLETCRGP
jgi:hypothetical protein